MKISSKAYIYICSNILFIFVIFAIREYCLVQCVSNSYIYVSLLSAILLVIQLLQLRNMGIPLLSVISVFVILSHVFNFGYYYLKAFGKEDFFLFGDWFLKDAEIKTEVGFFSLLAISCVVIGIIIAQDKKRLVSGIKDIKSELDEELTLRIIRNVGLTMMLIILPCRFYWDYKLIVQSLSSGGYIGGVESGGLIGDIQALFIPAFICWLYPIKEKSRCKIYILIYVVLCSGVMLLSGSRRYFITGIIVMLIFYLKESNRDAKVNVKKYVLIAVALFFFLNLMTFIRNTRLINSANQDIISSLFSVDFLWESFAEFGITGNVIYYTYLIFPTSVGYMIGQTYLNSIVYILPIGWLIKLKASVGSIVYEYSHNAVGGSYISDLYANWGYFSLPAAVITGFIIGWLCAEGDDRESGLETVIKYAVGYFVINYVRSSTMEILRGSVYSIIMITVLYRIFKTRIYKRY